MTHPSAAPARRRSPLGAPRGRAVPASAGRLATLLVVGLGSWGCGWGEPAERSAIRSVAVRPGTSTLAVTVLHTATRSAEGVEEARWSLYLVDAGPAAEMDAGPEAEADAIERLVHQAAPDSLRAHFDVRATGWRGDTVFVALSGCPAGTTACGDGVRSRVYLAVAPDGELRPTLNPALPLDPPPGRLLGEAGRKVFFRASTDGRVVALRTELEAEPVPRYEIRETGELVAVAR
jgi:hypothetical protein